MSNLNTLLEYDPHTGYLTWKHRPDATKSWNTRYAGTRALASQRSDGYLEGSINNKRQLAHRIICSLMYVGHEGHVDHINGVRSDNRLSNLRVVTQDENNRNMSKMRHNTSGDTGVSYNSRDKVWVGFIHDEGSMVRRQFKRKEDAVEWRSSKEVELGYHPNHGVDTNKRKEYE